MLTRIISGAIGAAILIIILLLPPYALALTVLAASIIAFYEYSKAMKEKNILIDLPAGIIASVLIICKAYAATLNPEQYPQISHLMSRIFTGKYSGLLIYLLVGYLFFRFIFNKSGRSLEDNTYTLFGIAYIPFLLSFIIKTRNLDEGLKYIWIILIGSFITDIFAYFVGVAIGKNKIIPHISPKKTVEGSVGGAIGCMVFMVLYGAIIVNREGANLIPVYHFAILGLLCGVLAQIGDWAASSIKRYTGIKDFGNLIPGHGGIMDRVDSILFVAPLVYFYINQFIT
jgi:phosphatidate cytidylyltransferase